MKLSKAIWYGAALAIIRFVWAPYMPVLIVYLPMMIWLVGYLFIALWGVFVFKSGSTIATKVREDMLKQMLTKVKRSKQEAGE